MEKTKIQQVRENFKQNLSKSGWDRILLPFIDSEEFDTLINALEEAINTTGITPSLKEVFRLFYECPYNKLSTVLVVQGPYPDNDMANGIALCCGKMDQVGSYQQVMFQEIQETVYKDEGWYAWEADLKRWSNQGVLMLNTSLTTEPGSFGKHEKMWDPFISFLFNRLAELNTGLVYIIMGKVEGKWIKAIPETNYKLTCYHPASGCHNGGIWDSNDVFVRTNEILEGANGTKIVW